jgi:hypothetical protein
MTLLVRTCRQLTGQRVSPTRVQFIHRRDDVRPGFVAFFGAEVEFGAALDGATFAATIANLPTVGC